MTKHQIKFNKVEQVKEFVNAASQCDFDIDVSYNRVIVDAKSFLGVLSLASVPVLVAMHGENYQFNKLCQKYAC